MGTSEDVRQAVKSVEKAPVDRDIRITRRLEVGMVVMQGDVYLHRVAEDWSRGKQVGEGSVQIALGTGSGARHMAEGAVRVYAGVKLPEGVSAPDGVAKAEILGPVVEAEEPWTLTHPEHPHHKLPAGCYQTTYQVDMRTMRRVMD